MASLAGCTTGLRCEVSRGKGGLQASAVRDGGENEAGLKMRTENLAAVLSFYPSHEQRGDLSEAVPLLAALSRRAVSQGCGEPSSYSSLLTMPLAVDGRAASID